jgi:dienelactone hydrolase
MTATVLIATDIFGNTPAISELIRQLAAPCIVVSPYQIDLPPGNEQQAYQAFLANGGLAAYARKVAGVMQEHADMLGHIIGFSAGASACWMNSGRASGAILSTTLFYGSRIRDYLEMSPNCTTLLIFAEEEPGFLPIELVASLKQRGHQAEIAHGTRHGFMNPYSPGFSLSDQGHYLEFLRLRLRST